MCSSKGGQETGRNLGELLLNFFEFVCIAYEPDFIVEHKI